MTNAYHMLARLVGTPDAPTLAEDLARWHDRMVAHVRRHGPRPASDCCADDDCPANDAPALWALARRAFGPRATELTFLCKQGTRRTT